MTNTIPFGLLFEEALSTIPDVDDILPEPVYDPQESLSYVLNTAGQRVPFITYAFIMVGLTKTGSATKQLEDSDDWEEDPPKSEH